MKLEETVDYGSREAVIQNLKDAGCTQEMMECIMTHLDEDDMGELLKLLEQHRSCLLSMVHERENRLTVWIIWFTRLNGIRNKGKRERGR